MRRQSDQQGVHPQSAETIVNSGIFSRSTFVPEYQINPLHDGSFLVVDKTQRNFVGMFWVSLLCILVLGFILVGQMPSSYIKITDSQRTCANPVIINSDNTLSCLDFSAELGMVIKGMSKENQHLILNSHFFFNDTSNNTKVDQSIRLAQYKLSDDGRIQNMILQEYFDLSVDNYTRKSGFFTNQSKLLGVKSHLLYQHQIYHHNLLIIAEFMNTSTPTLNLKNVTIQTLLVNPGFSSYQKNIRIAFFLISIFTFIVYLIRLAKIDQNKRVLQHRFITSLSVIVIVYNNPLIAALIVSNNKFLLFLLQFCYILLPVTLILFWICIFQRGDLENNLQFTTVLKKPLTWILISLLFIFQLTLYLYKSYRHLRDYVGSQFQQTPLVGLKYTCFFLVIPCYVLVMIHIVNVFTKTRTMLRYKRLASMSVFIIVLSLLLMLTTQYGVYSTQPKSMFLSLYFFNVYIYYLQLLYMKTEISIPISPARSQNVISEPQVIYGNEPRKHPFFDGEGQEDQKKEIQMQEVRNIKDVVVVNSRWNSKLMSKTNEQTNDENIGNGKIPQVNNNENLQNFDIEGADEKDGGNMDEIEEIGEVEQIGHDLNLEQKLPPESKVQQNINGL